MSREGSTRCSSSLRRADLLHPFTSSFGLLHPASAFFILLHPSSACFILLRPSSSFYILLRPSSAFYREAPPDAPLLCGALTRGSVKGSIRGGVGRPSTQCSLPRQRQWPSEGTGPGRTVRKPRAATLRRPQGTGAERERAERTIEEDETRERYGCDVLREKMIGSFICILTFFWNLVKSADSLCRVCSSSSSSYGDATPGITH